MGLLHFLNNIGIIGLGTLGTALARGWHRVRPDLHIFATTRSTSLPAFVTPCASNAELASRAQTLLLCVKPQQAAGVLDEIAPALTPHHRVISTCTGVLLAALAAAVPPSSLVARAMPNIPCEFNEGVTALGFTAAWPGEQREELLRLFALLGDAVALDERHFDAVTALSGCGPAYLCVITEALSDAGVKAGLPRDVARRLSVQTLLGSAVLLRSVDEHPAAVRDRVTTPGGCTIDALTRLEEGGLRATLIAAVTTAAAKSAALSRYAQSAAAATIAAAIASR
ncbi:MAG TPA: pyrroline-5-carboxylate reductase [Candidatus Baltobacteraceae bacterium]|nr:pyrroline-5-carboxylate reductase [Candidatus Baltobacteraceae bacterium]